MFSRSPNEIANDLAKLQRDARLRRLKAVRDAASRLQQQRLSSFRKHFTREKAIQEEAAHIEKARITLSDITALEDELRLALSQMGAAHQSALTFNAQLTEEMLRQNESFKAHIALSNLRCDAAIGLVREFRREQRILKSAPGEQRAAAFARAKMLLKRIAAINERSKLRQAEMGLCHPYNSINQLMPAAPADYRVTRIHAEFGAPDAVSLAQIENDRHQERIRQAEGQRQRRSQVAEQRAEVATDIIQSRRTATEMQSLLQEAVVQDRQRRLQLAKQRSSMPPRPKQSKIKRAFESALPQLRSIQRTQNVKEAERRLRRHSADGPAPRDSSRPESPEDLLERFPNSDDAAVVPSDLLQNVVNISVVADDSKEDCLSANGVNQQDARSSSSNGSTYSKPSKDSVYRRQSTSSIQNSPLAEPSNVAHSPPINESRRPVSFTVRFDDEVEQLHSPPRRSPSPSVRSSRSPPSVLKSRRKVPRGDSPEVECQSVKVPVAETIPEASPSKIELNTDRAAQTSLTDNHNSSESASPVASFRLPSPERADDQTQASTFSPNAKTSSSQKVSQSLAENDQHLHSLTRATSSSVNEVAAESNDLSHNIGSETVLSPIPRPADDQNVVELAQPVSTTFDSAGLPNGSRVLEPSERLPSPSNTDLIDELTNLLPSVDLSLDDLEDLDRRAEELLRSHIPTTPQLLALPRDPEQDVLDFHLDEDADDYAIRMLDVDSDKLAASFARTLDETLEFLRQSRQEIDNLRGDSAPDPDLQSAEEPAGPSSPSHNPIRSRGVTGDEISQAGTATEDPAREDADHAVSRAPSNAKETRSPVAQQGASRQVSIIGSVEAHPDDLNTSAVSSERTTDDDRSSSLQEQFRANVALIERIEQRRAEVRQRRQSH